MNLKHTCLYAKGWYKRSDSLLADMRETFKADDYLSDTYTDMINVLYREVTPIWEKKMGRDNFILDMLETISPRKCWQIGGSKENYHYEETAIRYFLSRLSNLSVVECDGLPEPDYNVLPKGEDVR